MWRILVFLLFLTTISQGQDLYPGDRCNLKDGRGGACILINNCPSAISDIKKGILPLICSYQGRNAVVCCAGATTSTSTGTTAKPTTKAPTTSKLDANGCPPIPKDATTLVKTGRKAIDKCIDYLELVYPCVSGGGFLLNAPKVRDPAGQCGFSSASLIVGGQEAKPNEFPHMVSLGFGDDEEDISWQCGGALVSDWFVLTAGHCIYSVELGDVTYALLGAHKKTLVTKNRLFTITDIIKHPNYKSPSKYNDLALLKLDRQVIFDEYVRPACLPTEKEVKADKVVATGWGALSFGDKSGSDFLMKVRLELFTFDECSRTNQVNRQLKEGIIDDQQICAGHHTEVKDTCQGDSGGPLQIVKPNIYCMFEVIGITSFGKACGTPGQPGVYSRVSYYTPWIESVIWP